MLNFSLLPDPSSGHSEQKFGSARSLAALDENIIRAPAEASTWGKRISLLCQPQRLNGRGFWISIEDRIDVLHDVAGDIEEIPSVLQRDERALGAVVHGDLEERLDERAQTP